MMDLVLAACSPLVRIGDLATGACIGILIALAHWIVERNRDDDDD